jgi:hypothetical protein
MVQLYISVSIAHTPAAQPAAQMRKMKERCVIINDLKWNKSKSQTLLTSTLTVRFSLAFPGWSVITTRSSPSQARDQISLSHRF